MNTDSECMPEKDTAQARTLLSPSIGQIVGWNQTLAFLLTSVVFFVEVAVLDLSRHTMP